MFAFGNTAAKETDGNSVEIAPSPFGDQQLTCTGELLLRRCAVRGNRECNLTGECHLTGESHGGISLLSSSAKQPSMPATMLFSFACKLFLLPHALMFPPSLS